jgi:uncharacterized protein YecT (DUF1311 family)
MLRPILALACLALPAAAQEVDCANAMAQADLNACAYQDWEEADADLNAAYKQAMAVMDEWDANLPKTNGRRAGVERGAACLDHLPRQDVRGGGLCLQGRQRRAACWSTAACAPDRSNAPPT